MTTETNHAFDILREHANAAVKDAPLTRRPTYAPPITFPAELAAACAGYAEQCGNVRRHCDRTDLGRLWARFLDPRDRYRPTWAAPDWHACCGFQLRVGTKREGWKILELNKHYRTGEWGWCGRLDIRELTLNLITGLAGNDEPIVAGCRVIGVCRCCFRTLTDPVSIERGIGPECFGKVTVPKLETAWKLRADLLA